MRTDREYVDQIVSRLQKGRVVFVHSPDMWDECNLPVELHWQRVRFGKDYRNQVPSDKFGVYAFMLAPNFIGVPESAYLLYIGQTHGFRARYVQYLHEYSRGFARPPISRMLERWYDHIWFHYAPLGNPCLLDKVEDALLNACIPPYNQKYKGRVGRAIRAFKTESGG